MKTDPNLLRLRVAGAFYAGWTAVSVSRSLESVAGGFELQFTADPDQPLPQWKIPPGEKCEVLLGDDVVLVGYVDDFSVSYSASQHELKASGRDQTGDLVDCSAPTISYAAMTLPELAAELAKPFHIKVARQGKKAGFQRVAHSNQPGESVFRVLERRARQEAVLLISDNKGTLLIAEAGAGGDSGVSIVYGRDIKEASFQHSGADLFSEIVVKGQAAGGGNSYSLDETVQPQGTVSRKVTDKGVSRYRPLCIVAETQADGARCAKRAQWEAGNREAKAKKWEVTVAGWRNALGAIWSINTLVHLQCPLMAVDEKLLITSVELSLDDSGSITKLKLAKQDAYKDLPEIPAQKKASAGNPYSLKD